MKQTAYDASKGVDALCRNGHILGFLHDGFGAIQHEMRFRHGWKALKGYCSGGSRSDCEGSAF